MKKDGFTLIELLAVIVILAVIALIVTPIVTGIIKSAKDSANARSVEGHIKNVEYIIVQNAFNNGGNTNMYDGTKVESDLTFTYSANDNIRCGSYIILDGIVTKATGCKAEGWTNSYIKEEGKNAVKEDSTSEPPVVQTAAGTLIKKANNASITNYNNGVKTEMFTFSHAATSQTGELTDYRYIGNNPNNYVTFNSEVWRTIGVFTVDDGTGNLEQRVKLIRQDSIGDLIWNTASSNDWSSSSLKTDINSGTFYTGLDATSLNMIGDSKYYLGGKEVSNLNGENYYTFERGTTVYSGNNTNWVGKVGLMYPSDYVYTYAYEVDALCYNDAYNCDTSAGIDNSWLRNSTITQWTISPKSDSSSSVYSASKRGFMNTVGNGSNLAVRPTIYLKSSVQILSGTGEVGNPYIIG